MRRWLFGRREQPPGQTRPFAHRRLHPAPFGGGNEECPTIFAAQHARETAAIDGDGIEHLATLPHAHAMLARDAGDPHGTVSVRADAVGCVLEDRPDATADEAAAICARGGQPVYGTKGPAGYALLGQTVNEAFSGFFSSVKRWCSGACSRS